MSDILLDVQSPPATPSAGQIVVYGDSVSKKFQAKNDAGEVSTLVTCRRLALQTRLVLLLILI
jgi:hypothetical protein